MIQEEALIPYQTSPLPEGPWLVFAPHPDDETFGMGGSLTLAARKAVGVTLVVLTDGSMGGRETGSDNIISIREKEVREISTRLHLESVLFWRQPDRASEGFTKSRNPGNKTDPQNKTGQCVFSVSHGIASGP